MLDFHHPRRSTARMAAGVRTALVVLVLGVIAVIADVSLTSPRALLLEDARGVPAEVAAIHSGALAPTGDLALVGSARGAGMRALAADPSVPSAASLPLVGDEAAPPTF